MSSVGNKSREIEQRTRQLKPVAIRTRKKRESFAWLFALRSSSGLNKEPWKVRERENKPGVVVDGKLALKIVEFELDSGPAI
jgi:hypothetical protein